MPNPTFIWEDRDLFLVYKSIPLEKLEKVSLLGVPIDNITRDEAMAKILSFLEKKDKLRYVLFLDPVKLLHIKPKNKLSYLTGSDLILVEGKGIGWGLQKFGYQLKERINKISLLMDLFRLAHKGEYTIYLLGSRQEDLEKIYMNLTRNLPGIRIIGKQSGFFNKEWEEKIKESIRKTSPDIVLIGMGFPRQEKWVQENKDIFCYRERVKAGNRIVEKYKYSVIIGVDNAFEILSGNRRVPGFIQHHGLEWIWRVLKQPYRLDFIFRIIQYYVLIVWHSLFRKHNR